MASSISIVWTRQFPVKGMSIYTFVLHYFIESHGFNANRVDPDQTPRSLTSDVGLHCLPMSFFYCTLGINGLGLKKTKQQQQTYRCRFDQNLLRKKEKR